jgi:glycosyltransferase involved in cell wall biosynthesis
MKVAITHPYSWPEVRRGAERITVESSRALAARGHDVTLLTAGAEASRTTGDGFTTVRYRRIFDDALRHERWFGWRLLPVLARGGFDVVHSLMPCDMAAAIRVRRLAGHGTVYDEMGIPYRWWWNGLKDKRVRKYVMREVDVYGCMSQFALDVLEGEQHRKGVLIPGGVRIDQFSPATEREPSPTILFSGAFMDPSKNLPTLLEALGLLAERIADVKLWLSGPGDPAEYLEAAPAAARERTELLPLGGVEDQGVRYSRAWVTTLPSKADSFGVAMLESLACGTPIVVSDKGAPQELVTPQTGVVSIAGNAESLCEALAAGFELSGQPGTVEACRAVAAEYDWDLSIAPLLEDLYEQSRQTSSLR